MDSWVDSLRELRGEFVREAAVKLERIAGCLDQLERDHSDRAALHELMRTFHGFSGSGTTYGFPAVTALGRKGESETAGLLRTAGAHPSPPDLAGWRTLLDSLRSAFEGEVPEPVPAAAPLAPRPSDILLVDDDPELLERLTRLFEQEGMAVRSAASKAEAERSLASRMPDGMVVDIRLLDGTGYELVEHVRGLPGGEAVAVLMLSVLTGFLDKVEAIHCGADGYFEKPVDWEALMRRLIHLLQRDSAGASRVLSVEDDPVEASFLRTVLESAGFEFRVCADPARFDAELIAFRPDLLLMDIVLPTLSGYDLVRYLRQDERYATLPVVFLSTEDQMEAQILSAKAGGDEHLIKPVNPALLLTTVAVRIERSRFLKSLLGHDGLTRLLTHSAFIERAQILLSRKRRNLRQASAAWVMIDIDHFKKVNDEHGHPVGDRVISALAAHLRRRLRQSDTIGRYGGEEFAVLLDDLNQVEAVRLVERIREEFAAMEHLGSEGERFRATFSAGVAVFDAAHPELESWRKAADAALYRAKAEGRNRTVGAASDSA